MNRINLISIPYSLNASITASKKQVSAGIVEFWTNSYLFLCAIGWEELAFHLSLSIPYPSDLLDKAG